MPLPIVAIVGLPNVGKSTLFNRILKRHQAVVDPTPGVTRDRQYAETEWEGFPFTLVDTGGYLPDDHVDQLMDAVREQTLIAARQADLVLLLADAQVTVSDADKLLAGIIIRETKNSFLVANKVDDPTTQASAYELMSLGMGEPFLISAKNGFQVGELLDAIVERLRVMKPVAPSRSDPDELALAVIGAPNSGKSSLVNKLCGSGRMVVSDIPGTTRDAVDTVITYHGKPVRLIDTAGLRRKRANDQGIDFYSSIRSIRALDRCDVAIVMLDGSQGLTQGDIRLVSQAAEKGVGVILAVNKWDLVEKDQKTADNWIKDWNDRVPSLGWVPVRFISALTGQRAIKLIEDGFAIKGERDKRITTAEINETIIPQLIRTPPPAVKGRFVKIKYGAQVSAVPPVFSFFASHADTVAPQYKRFVEKLLRESYGFDGVPLTIEFRFK